MLFTASFLPFDHNFIQTYYCQPTFGSNPFGGANTAAAVSLNKPFGMSSAAPTGFGMNQNNPSGNLRDE